MASAVSRVQVKSLYRQLLRQSRLFADFNFRKYAERRVRDAFKEKKFLTDPELIHKEYTHGTEQLHMLHRQVQLSQMFAQPKLVVERTT